MSDYQDMSEDESENARLSSLRLDENRGHIIDDSNDAVFNAGIGNRSTSKDTNMSQLWKTSFIRTIKQTPFNVDSLNSSFVVESSNRQTAMFGSPPRTG